MEKEKINNPNALIRTFYKELISVYKTRNYKEEIVKINPSRNGVPTYQLRFIKQGEHCKYYRILLKDKVLD